MKQELTAQREFERDLQPMTHCGRIYHMVPRKRRDEGCCGCCSERLTCTIYPAHPSVFGVCHSPLIIIILIMHLLFPFLIVLSLD
jgi:hypothetical protein